jgi:hypothetical protein
MQRASRFGAASFKLLVPLAVGVLLGIVTVPALATESKSLPCDSSACNGTFGFCYPVDDWSWCESIGTVDCRQESC